MTGARLLAKEYIVPQLRAGQRVLDVCCGDGWTSKLVLAAGGTWFGIDRGGMDSIPGCPRRILGDVTKVETFMSLPECSDLILDVYGSQHLMDRQAKAWDTIAVEIADGGRFISVGRYLDPAGREMNRQDPLNGFNRQALEGLGLASGLRLLDFKMFRYEGDSYKVVQAQFCDEPNAYAATFERW